MKLSFIAFTLLFALCLSQATVKHDFLYQAAMSHLNSTKKVSDDETINVFIVGHTHDDPGWLVTTDEYYVKQVRYILDTVVAALKANKQRKYTYVEQSFFQRWWHEQPESIRDDVRQLVKEGRLELNLGGWVMADEATCHYEDVINEMSLGAKFIYDEFGVRPTVGWHVDPFGHSSQMASLYHDMGFDVFAFWRIHYDDVNERKATQKLEFVWRGSQSSGAKSDVFSHYLDSGYGSPGECDFFANSGGECYYWTGDDRWLQWDDDLPTYKNNVEYHAERFANMVRTRAAWFDNGNNLLIPWGTDFTFVNAFIPFANMDKFIDYMNAHQDKYHIHMQYAVLSDYAKAVHAQEKKWDVKTGDFFPYADRASGFWTGYFTSRDRLKGLVRQSMNELANAEMYLSFSKIYKKNVDLETAFNYVMKLRKAQGEVQHHDAITGTEKQVVANDYNVQLVDGAYFANKAAASILSEFTFASDINKNSTEVFPSLTKDNSIAVFLSNDVAWNRKETIQIILPRSDIGVYDRSNNEIESQINEIPEFSYDRRNGTHYLYFVAEIPAMGYNTYYLKIKENAHVERPVNADSISNDNIKLNIENGYVKTADLSTGEHLELNANLYQYKGSNSAPQNSGAYAFVPAYTDNYSIGSSGDVNKEKDVGVSFSMEEPAYLLTPNGNGYDDTFATVSKESTNNNIKTYTHRIDKETEGGWGQDLGLSILPFDLKGKQENSQRGSVDIGTSDSKTKYVEFKFETPFPKDSKLFMFTSVLTSENVVLTTSIVELTEEGAKVRVTCISGDKWEGSNSLKYIVFVDGTFPFPDYVEADHQTGFFEVETDKDGHSFTAKDFSSPVPCPFVIYQAYGDEAVALTSSSVNSKSAKVDTVIYVDGANKHIKVAYIAIARKLIADYVVPETTALQTTIIRGSLVEEVQQTYRDGYHTVFRLYKQGVQSNVVEVNTELNGIDDGRELVLQFNTNLKNSRTIYSDTNGLEQQKRVMNLAFTMPVSGNFYPCVARAYIEDDKEDLRLSVLVDRAHGVSSLDDGRMEIMVKRRTTGDDGYGVSEPLTENDQVKEKFWLVLGKKEQSTIYKQYDVLMTHFPVQFFATSEDNSRINGYYSSLLAELPPQIQLLNFQLAGVDDKTFILRLHHIYEKDESVENSIPVDVDLSKIFKDFEIVDYEEMILSGQFNKEQVEKERMKWMTVDGESAEEVEAPKKTSMRGGKSFVVTLNPMEFKTFQVVVNM